MPSQFAGEPGFDLVTWIPGSHPRDGAHPLEAVLHKVPSVAPRLRPLLELGSYSSDERVARRDGFEASGHCGGARVLLIDDTWTTGAAAISAA